MKRVLSIIATVIALLLTIPTGLILASWNALPGDRMYPIKTGLEKVAVKIVGGSPLERKLEVKYTERRFSEADTLLTKKQSTIGFAYLTDQAKTAKDKIIQAQDSQTKVELVENLSQFNQTLEERKEGIKTSAPSTSPPAPVPPSPAPGSQEPKDIIEDIEETQEEIEEIIDELEEEVPSPSEEGSQIEQEGEMTTDDDLEKVKWPTGRRDKTDFKDFRKVEDEEDQPEEVQDETIVIEEEEPVINEVEEGTSGGSGE